jgi:hypothetical protein
MCGRVICLSYLIATELVSASQGWATEDVKPDDIKAVRGTTVAARPELAGTVLRDKSIDFEIRNADGKVVFAGKVQDRVSRSDRDKTLSFEFRIRDTKPDLPGRIKEVRREGFGDRKTDLDYSRDGLGTIGPDSVTRDKKGATVGFSFAKTPITPGTESRFSFALTDATEFDGTKHPGVCGHLDLRQGRRIY